MTVLNFPIIEFPLKYYIEFRFGTYKKPSFSQPSILELKNTVRLPIPKNLVDSLSQNYSEENLGPIIGSMLETVENLQQANALGAISSAIDTTVAASRTALQGALSSGVGAAIQTQRNLGVAGALGSLINEVEQKLPSGISAKTGALFNPFQTVLFKNPNFKVYNFEWLFTPKNANESTQLNKIINMMRYHMSPEFNSSLGSSSVIMKYPDIVEIELMSGDLPNEYLPKFKKCVVKNLAVNYTPSGVPSFFKDTKAPTAIKMGVQLQEIEIWTKETLPTP